MKENQVVSLIVLTLGQALNAGFVPENGMLRHTSGATIPQSVLALHNGKIVKGIGTGNAQFPVTIDGQIFHKSLVSLEKSRKGLSKANGSKYDLVSFQDGTLLVSIPGYGDFPLDQFDVADEAAAATTVAKS